MIIYEEITYQLTFLEKITEKKFFFIIFFNKFIRKISYNIKISSSDRPRNWTYYIDLIYDGCD